MKTSTNFFLYLVLFGITTAGCKKETPLGPQTQSVLECEIDGEQFKAQGFHAYAVNDDETYLIYGVDLAGFAMYISVDQGVITGTHELYSPQNYAVVSYDEGDRSYSTYWSGSTGEVSISERTDTYVKGTFSFTAKSSEDKERAVEVKNGRFEVAFRD